MARDNRISRRTAMKLTGAAAATTLVAGCGGDGGDENGDENGSDGGDGGDGVEIDPGTEIMFAAEGTTWVGNSSEIDGEENPTLILTEGEQYTIGWDENDGSTEHNIALYDDSESVVEDYETDTTADPGEDQIIEFEATSDIAEYVCVPHIDSGMRGDIQVEGGNGGGNGNESEENGNESEENGNESEMDGNETEANGNESEMGGNETEANGNESDE